MNDHKGELQISDEDLLRLLESLLPDGPGYGRRRFNENATILDIDGTPVLEGGAPRAGYESIAATLAETSMTLEITVWSGLEPEPTLARAFWGSRLGLVSSRSRGDGSSILSFHSGGSLYEQVFDAVGLGPRPLAKGQALLTVKPPFLGALLPGAADAERKAALAKLADQLRATSPEIAADLAAERVRFITLDCSTFSAEGLRENSLAWIDTPSGVVVPILEGGVFTRQHFTLTMMPSWLAWKNILELLPTGDDLELWKELAVATASERVTFDV